MSISKAIGAAVLVGTAAMLTGCANAPIPVAENFQYTSQQKVRSAGHWELVSRDVVAQTLGTLNQAGAAGCMSGGTDPECAGVFQALAIDWKADGTGTGLPIAGGAAQTVFRPVAR